MPLTNSRQNRKSGVSDASHGLLTAGGKGVSHHGGPEAANVKGDGLQRGPFDRVPWTPIAPSEARLYEAETYDAADAVAVFALDSPSGDQGYPGSLHVEALITVSSVAHYAGKVHVQYRAELTGGANATPLNMTQHWGFNLAAPTEPTIDQHVLQLGPPGSSLRRLVLDQRGIPTGELDACKGAEHAWSEGKLIGDHMPAQGYDDFYVWGRQSADDGGLAARLSAPASRVKIEFRTNQAGAQLYTANGQPRDADALAAGGVRKRLHRRDDSPAGNATRSAAFLEFSAPHATFCTPGFAEIAGSDTILRAGYVYRNWVEICVGDA